MIAAIPEDIDRIATDLVRNPYVGCDDPEYEMYLAIARALQDERNRATEAERSRCAWIVEDNDEVTNLQTAKRSLEPRTEGNQVGMAYAAAIRNPTGE